MAKPILRNIPYFLSFFCMVKCIKKIFGNAVGYPVLDYACPSFSTTTLIHTSWSFLPCPYIPIIIRDFDHLGPAVGRPFQVGPTLKCKWSIILWSVMWSLFCSVLFHFIYLFGNTSYITSPLCHFLEGIWLWLSSNTWKKKSAWIIYIYIYIPSIFLYNLIGA